MQVFALGCCCTSHIVLTKSMGVSVSTNLGHRQSTLDTNAHMQHICDRARAIAHVTPAAGVPVEVSTYNCVMAACRVPPTRVVPVSFCTLQELLLCFGCDWLADICCIGNASRLPWLQPASNVQALGCLTVHQKLLSSVCRVCLSVCTLLPTNPRLLLGTKVPIMTPNKVNFPVYSFPCSPSVRPSNCG